MKEDLDSLFAITGTILAFPNGDVLGLPNYILETLYNGDYKVEKQDFRFIVRTSDIIDFEIEVDDEFSFEDTGYLYKFKVASPPINDLTGVSELVCDYLEKEIL